MDEYEELRTPYFEMTYLDDSRTMHLAKIQRESDVDFYKDRFDVVSCNYVSNF